MAFRLARPQHSGERARGGDHFRHGFAPARARQIVGVLALRQQREFQALAGREPRHRQIDRAERRAKARVVAVEAKHRLVGHFPDQRELVLGQGGAERRDGGGKARRHHGDDVDIAFDRDDAGAFVRRLAGRDLGDDEGSRPRGRQHRPPPRRPVWASARAGASRCRASLRGQHSDSSRT